ncbi:MULTISPECIES: fumarate hydratase [Candidatus Ichthyocystis]|uniref:Fumarate hydratase class I n=1 Tax=Candidatus Ichthyocystis hellenicum TaxID=1561003 RepID=A0A0S4M7H3_9BURK|nr:MULTISPECIES: fumarate hydratase [Ichthyocystis]CUT17348.1 Fumarate hydratase [Candidatus Ichthyocystis hellenicum]
MSIITKQQFIESIRNAFQFISYCHPPDFVHSLAEAYKREKNSAAKTAIAQILLNSKMSAENKRPMCQDTGISVVFIDVGMDVRWETDLSVSEMVHEGVRKAYQDPNNKLRFSIVDNPHDKRTNTKDNTPAVIHYNIVPGNKVEIHLAAKGGGSENKSRFVNLDPSASVVNWIIETLPSMGAGWCPPGILGIGIGGTPEYAMYLAKRSLMAPIDIHEIKERGGDNSIDKLRIEIYDRVNALGIGAQGLGGITTVLDVKVLTYPTHAVSLPVALIPNCASTRHVHFSLDGTNIATFPEPDLSLWPNISLSDTQVEATPVNIDTLTKSDIAKWQAGQNLLLSGTLYTARDAAHKRIQDMINAGKELPFDLRGKIVYYVGPVDPVRDEIIGPAGPTTADRMDRFAELMLSEKVGVIGMIGKGERKQKGIDAIKKYGAVSMIAVGGAAYLVSKSITKVEMIAFSDLGMEGVRKLTVKDMPVTVSVSSLGESIHEIGPQKWKISLKESRN